MDKIYNMLPDFCGILLAAVGVAIVIAPSWIEKLKGGSRWVIALVLLCLGVLGMRSSFTQHRDADALQAKLEGNVELLRQQSDTLRGKSDRLQSTVDSYGPKLDAIIAHPESPEQKAFAIALLSKLKPSIQIDDPFPNGARPSISFMAEVTNVGGSVAKGESSTANAQIDIKSKEAETRLFDYLYDHENDSDVKPKDMNPGYGSRSRVLILSRPPITPERLEQMKDTEVVYIGVLSTFSDEAGRKYHTEKCMYFDRFREHLNQFCDGHNITN
jgi:hypothetical protein